MRAPYYSPLRMFRLKGVPAGATWGDLAFNSGLFLIICIGGAAVLGIREGVNVLLVYPGALLLAAIPITAMAIFVFYRKACWSYHVHITLYPENDRAA